jgi:two-component system sensor histidine kinase TctE
MPDAQGLARPRSLRSRLLLWLVAPLVVFLALDAYANYRAALQTAQLAFDRLLVTSAHALADLIRLERGELQITLPHAALEIYDGAGGGTPEDGPGRSRMVYRVSFLDGAYLAGDEDLAPYRGRPPQHPVYQSMIELYDTVKGTEPMRMAALVQPVESFEGMRLVVVQVGESSAYRTRLAAQILRGTLLRQAGLLSILLLLIWSVATVALKPARALARQLDLRQARDLTPVVLERPPSELLPVVAGFNGLLSRLAAAQEQQRRFVADASHQLRTPLTVLQLQADAGLRGDLPEREALASVAATTRRATGLVQQLLSLARAQQAATQEPAEPFDLRAVAEDVAVELSPLLAQRHLDFQLEGEAVTLSGYAWMVHEILGNLLKNAIEFTPEGAALGMRIGLPAPGGATLTVWDCGPGLSEAMQEQVFTPFATDRPSRGSGLGLAICRDLALALGGSLVLHNRVAGGAVQGLDAVLTLP